MNSESVRCLTIIDLASARQVAAVRLETTTQNIQAREHRARDTHQSIRQVELYLLILGKRFTFITDCTKIITAYRWVGSLSHRF